MIKFRAKRLDNGGWICGDLHLSSPFPHIHSTLGDKAKIDTDTIGQFTGFKDNDGTEVYEGDIVIEREYFFRSRPCVVRYDEEYGAFKFFNSGVGSLLSLDFVDMKVIGNIYDSPELLNNKTE
jgi:uncharacterized phage protein (TIGR01671 family)